MAERPVTTILSIDLVTHPTSDVLDRCRAVLARFGGRVEPVDDDALSAAWGPSAAPAEDAERAVRAGLEVVQAGLATRAGVAAGDAERAAAVCASARIGEVWVDEPTRVRTAAAVRYVDQGRRELIGDIDPVRLSRADTVVALMGGEGRPSQLWVPLAGYQRELGLIKDTLHATIAESNGRLLVVRGAAGTGKTRLGTELEHYIDGLAGRVWWLWGRCTSYGGASSFAALDAVLRGRIAARENDDADTLSRKLERSLATLALTGPQREWLQPRLAALLSEDAATLAQDDLFAAWLFWLQHLGGREPVVWVVDDAHLAGAELVALIDYLVGHADSPILVLALARPDGTRPLAPPGGPEPTTIELAGLPDEPMAELVDGLLDDLSPSARTALVRPAGGVPLHPIERVRLLTDRGLVIDDVGRRRLSPSGLAALLSDGGEAVDLGQVIESRLELLPPPDRQLLESAAALGPSFSPDALSAVTGQDADAVRDGLDRLSDRDWLTRVNDPLLADFGQFAFVEESDREVAGRDRSAPTLLDRPAGA
jgi:hypothetical protein